WRRDEAACLLRTGLGEITLERLVGFLGEVGVKLAELAAARHETLVGGLEEIRLNLDRLLQALRAEQLFGCRRSVLEGFLRVVRNLACDRLGDFAERAELLEHDVRALASEFLEFIQLHHGDSLTAHRRSGARLVVWVRRPGRGGIERDILHCTIKSRVILRCNRHVCAVLARAEYPWLLNALATAAA